MRLLGIVLLLAAVGTAAWFVLQEDADRPDDTELDPGGDERRGGSREPVQMMGALGAMVVDKEPPGLFHSEVESMDELLFGRLELMQRRVRFPRSATKLTGEMILKAFASVAGEDKPFRFVGQKSLDEFKALEFEMPPPYEEMIEGLLALLPMRGWRPMARGNEFWMVTLEGREAESEAISDR